MSTHHVAAGLTQGPRTPARLRTALGLGALAEVVIFALVVSQLGFGWTILLTLATSALGFVLLARQGTRALADLGERAQTRQAPGRALGDAGLVALGGLLMVLPGFLGDVLGLLCLLPLTRALPRALIARGLLRHVPVQLRGPVRVRSTRTGTVGPAPHGAAAAPTAPPRVIEGEIVS
ncbi:UPF0716 protein FxsA [Modestobacter sp. DSM 44400]|uniref:FxsA family protein n=1 Tax=Modestobacter sp. DSM 44400 TaxID=1550230 RepID=UPI00089AEDB9|nr:FxsA family protein [Modestobacter sp. DSM 44400]SDY20834.1 UPF0716 protein FxsA [Modestobacter sp. DSM 44400]